MPPETGWASWILLAFAGHMPTPAPGPSEPFSSQDPGRLIEKLCNRSPEDVPLGDWEVHPHCTAGKLSPRDGEGLAKTM